MRGAFLVRIFADDTACVGSFRYGNHLSAFLCVLFLALPTDGTAVSDLHQVVQKASQASQSKFLEIQEGTAIFLLFCMVTLLPGTAHQFSIYQQ